MSSSKYDEDDEDIIEPVYNPEEYELRRVILHKAREENLVCRLTTYENEMLCCEVVWVTDYEATIIILTDEQSIERSMAISEIRFADIVSPKESKKKVI